MKKPENASDAGMREGRADTHLMMLGFYTVFGIMLMGFTLLLSWEKWTIPLLALSIILVWAVHISRIGTEQRQVYFYTGMLLLEIFYYGVHKGSFLGLSAVMSILLLALSVFGDIRLVYLAAAAYGAELLCQLRFLDVLEGMGSRQAAYQLCLDIGGVAGSGMLAGFLIGRNRREQVYIRKMIATLDGVNGRSEDFLANVSHELRTPVNAVTGISDIVLQKELPADLRASMISIQQAGKRLAGQINDILDYTDLIAGRLTVSNEDYLISSSINDMVVMADVQNSEGTLELVFDVDANIPSVLIGDEGKIRRVIKILLENAIKFTDEGGVYIHIGCRPTDYGINLGIDVCDTGIGMTASQLNHVYNEFYQADSGRSRRIGGMGLGLPIAHGLVHAMGGFMNIKSHQQKGTQVHISIPQKIGEEEPCMALQDPGAVCVACYIRQDKYLGEVREYYNRMLKNLGNSLGAKIYRVFHFSELQSLCQSQRLTHLLIGQEEYESKIDFYRDIGRDVCIVLIVGGDCQISGGRNLFLIRKPFYGLPIVNILNESLCQDNFGTVSMAEGLSCVGVKALVVDDDQMNLTVARGIFTNYGMEVDTCLSGEAALEVCMQTDYDIIFLDHMMPGMDGVETLKRIRMLGSSIYRELPIIALTANAVSGAREMFKGEGFDEFVAKPIERSVLERVLRRVLPGKCRRVKLGQPAVKGNREEETNVNRRIENSRPDEAGGKQAGEEMQNHKESEPGMAAEAIGEPEAISPAAAVIPPIAYLGQKGFNVRKGIGYCGDSEEFYLEMVNTFYQAAEQKTAEIVSFYEGKDWGNYTIRVHALKSSSRTIGAEELSGCAAGLEQAGKRQDIVYLEENQPLLVKLLEACRLTIGESMGIADKEKGISDREASDGKTSQEERVSVENAGETASAIKEIPEELWLEIVDRLSKALDTFESDQAETIIRKASGFVRHGHSCQELFTKIWNLVEDFDFDAAKEELETLAREFV